MIHEEAWEAIRTAILPPDPEAVTRASARWNAIAKPLHSLGRLEDLIIQIAGIQRSDRIRIQKKALVVFCADNGVVSEGVTQTGQEVTAIVAGNFLSGQTSAAIMAGCAGADVFPVDVGMVSEVDGLETKKTARGTRNIAKGPAMTPEETWAALQTGIQKAKDLREAGYRVLAAGEMGIGNTTTSAAVTSVLLHLSPDQVTGPGAGLSRKGIAQKIQVIRQAIAFNRPEENDPFDVLTKLGGFDLAAMTGLFLGGAAMQMPVVADGFISLTAALLAVRLVPDCRPYILPSHMSEEPAVHYLLDALEMKPILHAEMHLGEGTGAAALFPLLDMGAAVYDTMSTFDDIEIDAYQELL